MLGDPLCVLVQCGPAASVEVGRDDADPEVIMSGAPPMMEQRMGREKTSATEKKAKAKTNQIMLQSGIYKSGVCMREAGAYRCR